MQCTDTALLAAGRFQRPANQSAEEKRLKKNADERARRHQKISKMSAAELESAKRKRADAERERYHRKVIAENRSTGNAAEEREETLARRSHQRRNATTLPVTHRSFRATAIEDFSEDAVKAHRY